MSEPRHRPERRFPEAERKIIACELVDCPHCQQPLQLRKPWHMRKTVQTLDGPLFVAGKSKMCVNPGCSHPGQHYYASGVLWISLPYSTYGLDVLAWIGWQHEQQHRQLAEIWRELNQRGIAVNERNVGKLYRQFLALLGGLSASKQERLAAVAEQSGGLIWAIDALKPEGQGTLLYVLYEVLSETAVAATALDHPTADELADWLRPYQALPHRVLATLSDGEEAIIAAFRKCWPDARPQRCQSHWLSNLAEPVLKLDTQLREQMRQDLGGLPSVPEQTQPAPIKPTLEPPPFLPVARDSQLVQIETQLRQAIRDGVNRASRKPFHWGGLTGYQQLEGIAQALHDLPQETDTPYLHLLARQVDRVVEKNRPLAQDLAQAHLWLGRIADCLHYPPSAFPTANSPTRSITADQVRREMEALLPQFQPDLKRQPAQAALYQAWHRLWSCCGTDLLPCYDLIGLPPDNLKLEARFEQLRSHQRRISGRQSTQPLRDFGQSQILFDAHTQAELLLQIRQVSQVDYQTQLRRLAHAEAPRQNLYRMHRDPTQAAHRLVTQHATRRAELARRSATPPP